MADNKLTVPILYDEKEELYTIKVSPEEYEQITNGDQVLFQKLIAEEQSRKSITTIEELAKSNNTHINQNNINQDLDNQTRIELLETNDTEEISMNNAKETFIWPDKAILLFIELYREREHEFSSGLKRHNKLWSETALELQKLNYIVVSSVQVKMSSLKRTYKKIKDSNNKTGNYNSSWAYYSAMDSLFGDKCWVSPPAVASSDGPTDPSVFLPSTSASHSSSSSVDDYQAPSKPKKRKVETILESFISDLKGNRNQIKDERRKNQLEREDKKQQRWEERREMHKETEEIQRSLVNLIGKLIEKQNEPK